MSAREKLDEMKRREAEGNRGRGRGGGRGSGRGKGRGGGTLGSGTNSNSGIVDVEDECHNDSMEVGNGQESSGGNRQAGSRRNERREEEGTRDVAGSADSARVESGDNNKRKERSPT